MLPCRKLNASIMIAVWILWQQALRSDQLLHSIFPVIYRNRTPSFRTISCRVFFCFLPLFLLYAYALKNGSFSISFDQTPEIFLKLVAFALAPTFHLYHLPFFAYRKAAYHVARCSSDCTPAVQAPCPYTFPVPGGF